MSLHFISHAVLLSLTLASYTVCLKLFRRFNKAWLNPLYTSSLIIIMFLLFFNIPVDVYQKENKVFGMLLQLSIVAFAFPLYKQWPLLQRNYPKICYGVLSGTAAGVLAVFFSSQIFHFNHEVIASLIPRSVTLPIAIAVSSDLGGITSVTVFFVLFSGLFSVIVGPALLNKAGITSKAARGLAMGTSAQMLGANRSLIWGEEEGALGCIAMAASAILLSASLPLFLIFL
ncbi:LrgB family protein [Peribacillus sp. SCS-155]|uniref:LrgB family protein n=1 Tax=Peribacillus sedimenti TaxID=3115297 RepID=UPI003905C9E9